MNQILNKSKMTKIKKIPLNEQRLQRAIMMLFRMLHSFSVAHGHHWVHFAFLIMFKLLKSGSGYHNDITVFVVQFNIEVNFSGFKLDYSKVED